MTQYTREVVQTEILEDNLLTLTLKDLCPTPDRATPGDILAVEFAWRRDGEPNGFDTGYEAEAPSRLLVLQPSGGALFIPWYTLQVGLDLRDGDIGLIATSFSRMHHHYSLTVFEHLADMGHPAQASLLVANGYGALLAMNDDDEGIDEEDIPDDAAMQKHIWTQAAAVLPRLASSHARVASLPNLAHADRLIDICRPVTDPRNWDVLSPRAAL